MQLRETFHFIVAGTVEKTILANFNISKDQKCITLLITDSLPKNTYSRVINNILRLLLNQLFTPQFCCVIPLLTSDAPVTHSRTFLPTSFPLSSAI